MVIDFPVEKAAVADGSLSTLFYRKDGANRETQSVGVGSGLESDREEILLSHLATVRHVARRIHQRLPRHVELDDLVSEGTIGLMDAFNRFDGSRGVQFASYAQFRTRGAILDSLRTLDWSPRELRRKGRALNEVIRVLAQRLGRTPSAKEIADELEMSLEQVQELMADLKGLEVGSLNEERGDEGAEEELAYIPAAPEDDPFFRCMRSESRRQLMNAMEELSEKERLVLTLYYFEELTMKEIGSTLGVVESRISQIHSSAVRHLRKTLGAKSVSRPKMAA
jgi:RNA polymerase sigma factor FliA